MSIRILIADDHGILRAGLRALLNAESGFQVVGEASDSSTALSQSLELCPDIVLMDITMPGGGLETTQQLKAQMPNIRVLVLTLHEDVSLLREAIRVGASGYILKRAVESELIDAIRAVMRGELYVHPAMTRSLLTESPSPQTATETIGDTLTAREMDVLRLIVDGYTNRQVAEKLNLGVRTVETYRSNLMDKLHLHSRVELVRFAAEHRLFEAKENNPGRKG